MCDATVTVGCAGKRPKTLTCRHENGHTGAHYFRGDQIGISTQMAVLRPEEAVWQRVVWMPTNDVKAGERTSGVSL